MCLKAGHPAYRSKACSEQRMSRLDDGRHIAELPSSVNLRLQHFPAPLQVVQQRSATPELRAIRQGGEPRYEICGFYFGISVQPRWLKL